MNDEHIPNSTYDAEGVGLIKTLGFFLEIKVYGDRKNPGEDSLLEKFKKQVRTIVIGDGSTRIKVSTFDYMYGTSGSVMVAPVGASIEQRRTKLKPDAHPKKKPKKVANAMFMKDKKHIQFSTKDDIHEHPEEELI